MSEIKGDWATGTVDVRFESPEVLQGFIDLLNRNEISQDGGNTVLSFSLHQDRAGEPVLVMFTETSR